MRVHATFIIALYIACELTANITAGKITVLGPFTVPAAIYIFALTFTLLDLLNEGLGKRATQRVVLSAFGANLLLALYTTFAANLPTPAWFANDTAYDTVFLQTPRIILASLSAYIVASLLDVELFARLRARLNPGWRVIVSNALSTLIDSVLFITIAFAGAPGFDTATIGMLIVGQYVVKLAVTLVSVPLIYFVRATVDLEKQL